jgi:hypothetical protein
MGELMPGLSTGELVESSDLIVVGRVERVQQTGAGEAMFHEHTYARRDFRGEITVDQIIKGDSVSSNFILSYSTPAMGRFGDVAEEGLIAKSYRIVFLKKTPSGYAFASPYYPSLPASPMACGPDWDLGQDAYHKVLQRVLNVLCTRSGTDEKRVGGWHLYSERRGSVFLDMKF